MTAPLPPDPVPSRIHPNVMLQGTADQPHRYRVVSGPPGWRVLLCPIEGCRWTHVIPVDRPLPTVHVLDGDRPIVTRVSEGITRAIQERDAQDELVLADHLAAHGTVRIVRQLVAERQRADHWETTAHRFAADVDRLRNRPGPVLCLAEDPDDRNTCSAAVGHLGDHSDGWNGYQWPRTPANDDPQETP